MSIDVIIPDDPPKAKRGTSNANDRGSAADRRRRRAWLMLAYASDVPGFVRCYRCGGLIYNPDDVPPTRPDGSQPLPMGMVFKLAIMGDTIQNVKPLTVDRIIPGCKGGTYRRNNIRPACGGCNSETGGALAARKG